MAFSMKGFVNIDNSAPAAAVSMNLQQDRERATIIFRLIDSLLDSDDPEIYTAAVEGICKLYTTGHIVLAPLLSKLIIMYYSPKTEDDVKLRACLSCFLPKFSFFRPSNQVCVEKAFMPVLKCLIDAPPHSDLSKIDLTKVMKVMFTLTDPRNLLHRVQHFNTCHENIVRSILHEVLNNEKLKKRSSYLKVKAIINPLHGLL